MEKFSNKHTLKDEEFKALHTHKPTNPIYHPHKHLHMLKSKEENKLMSECHPQGVKRMLDDLNAYSNNILEKLEKTHEEIKPEL